MRMKLMVHEEIARSSEDGPKFNVLVHEPRSLVLYSAQVIFSAVLRCSFHRSLMHPASVSRQEA
jgi:hypothetical protein